MQDKVWVPSSDWTDRMLVDGQEVQGQGPELAVENPATGGTITTIRTATVAQVDEAVAAARRAFDAGIWANDAELRKRVLLKLADLLEQHSDDIGGAMIEEVGTPIGLVKPLQIGVPVGIFRYFAGLATTDFTKRLGPDGNAAMPSESIVRYVPCGVVAAISAYNYPLLILALKLGAALAAGCTVVALPSPQTPLSTLLFARLLKEAGVPDGVVNIVVGGVDVGQRLSSHPDVDKVAFTGSVAVGRAVMQQAAQGIKDVVLELGGKSAAVLLPGSDPAKIMSMCHLRYLRNAGQGCASPARILVHQDSYDDFVGHSRAFFETVKVGSPWDADTVVGPLISRAHRDRVQSYVDRAVAAGAEIVAQGSAPAGPGWYMAPMLLGNLDNSFEIAREELFGPVGIVMPYRDVDHAIAIANDNSMGLAASVIGPLDQAQAVARRLRAGSVYINGGGMIRMDAPMGGFKQSGIGREYGVEGLFEYLEPQHIQWALPPA